MARRVIEIGAVGRRVAENLARLREHRRLNYTDLSGLLARRGRTLSAETLGKVERRERRIDVDDLVALAVALGVTPNRLLLPANVRDDEPVELLPEVRVSAMKAWKWAAGDEPLGDGFSSREHLAFIEENQPHRVARLDDPPAQADARQHPGLANMAAAVVNEAENLGIGTARLIGIIALVERWRLVGTLDAEIARLYRDEGARPTLPQQQPVVAAIVTSDLGVLVGRRNDRTPPWTFIAGEVEPGELPEDAAVREVKEETGLEIEAGERIGERDHPATGRHMIYIAGRPVRDTNVFVGDRAELAEVRWVSLAEADELQPGMFGPVREYLARAESHGGHGI